MKPTTKWTHIGSVAGVVIGVLTELVVVDLSGERIARVFQMSVADRLLVGAFFGIGIGATVGMVIGGAFQGKALPWREIRSGMIAGAVLGAIQWSLLSHAGGFFIGGVTGAILGFGVGKQRERFRV